MLFEIFLVAISHILSKIFGHFGENRSAFSAPNSIYAIFCGKQLTVQTDIKKKSQAIIM